MSDLDRALHQAGKVLAHLTQALIPVRVYGELTDVSVGELIDAVRKAATSHPNDGLPQNANSALRRYGIRLLEAGVCISTNHTQLARLFRDITANWLPHLQLIEGTKLMAENVWFTPGSVTPAIWMPFSSIPGMADMASAQAAEEASLSAESA